MSTCSALTRFGPVKHTANSKGGSAAAQQLPPVDSALGSSSQINWQGRLVPPDQMALGAMAVNVILIQEKKRKGEGRGGDGEGGLGDAMRPCQICVSLQGGPDIVDNFEMENEDHTHAVNDDSSERSMHASLRSLV